MLLKNIDVSDGLVNLAFGSIGNIVGISQQTQDNNDHLPTSIHVVFDYAKVGKKTKQWSKTCITEPEEE